MVSADGTTDGSPGSFSPQSDPTHGVPADAPASPKLSQKALEDFAHRANQQIGILTQQSRSQEAVIAHLSSQLQVLAEAQAGQGGAVRPPEEVLEQLCSVERIFGYKPSMDQQLGAFAALAEWQATAGELLPNRHPDFVSNEGTRVKYDYADLSAMLLYLRPAANFGLSVTFPLVFWQGQIVVVAYMLHRGGGILSSGPFIPDLKAGKGTRNQSVAGGVTAAKRIALMAVAGIASAGEDTDFNPPERDESGGPRSQKGAGYRTGNRGQGQRPAARREAAPTTSKAPVHTGPPPGWLSKEDRKKLVEEIQDPTISPERFQEIEAKLIAADQLAQRTAAAAPAPASGPPA